MSKQIAVKVSREMLVAIDGLVEHGDYDSRSEAVREGLQRVLKDARAQKIDRAFRCGFSAHPDRPDELAEASRLAVEAIHDEPWEPWW